MKILRNKKLWPLFAAVLLVLCALLCFLQYRALAQSLESQQAAERWRGENETAFAQLSCFMPAGKALTEEEIHKFRSDMITKLTEASFEVSADTPLIHDELQYFGHIMQRANSLEKTLMLGKIEDRRRRGDRG